MFTRTLTLDLAERAIVVVLFAFFVHRMLPRLSELVLIERAYPQLLTAAAGINVQLFLMVLSELLVALLLLLRPLSANFSRRPLDWIVSFLAASLPLFAEPAPPHGFIPVDVAGVIIGAGLLVQIAAKLALWRSFGVVPANHGVKTGGPYALIRHPMYAGYIVSHIGFVLGYPLLQNALLYLATFGVQVVRILREEAILHIDPDYARYARRVRYRLIPGLF